MSTTIKMGCRDADSGDEGEVSLTITEFWPGGARVGYRAYSVLLGITTSRDPVIFILREFSTLKKAERHADRQADLANEELALGRLPDLRGAPEVSDATRRIIAEGVMGAYQRHQFEELMATDAGTTAH